MLYLVISNTLGVWMLVCPAIFMDMGVNGNHTAMAVVMVIVLLGLLCVIRKDLL